MDAFRTPEERFEGIGGFDHDPVYRELDGLRVAHYDTGEGPPVLMLHGEPAWSYIWRNVIPPVREAGYRCIAVDHAGFGRSDKPTDPAWYTLENHVAVTRSLLDDLGLTDVTLVVHDWGGPIGLALMLSEPELITGAVVLDTVLDGNEVWANELWVRFRDFMEETEDAPIGEVMRATCYSDPGDEVIAAYDAPYPDPVGKIGPRAMPGSAPQGPEATAFAERAFYGRLRADPRPIGMIWGEADLILTVATGLRLAANIGRRLDHVVPEAGHAIQEDCDHLGELIAGLLAANR